MWQIHLFWVPNLKNVTKYCSCNQRSLHLWEQSLELTFGILNQSTQSRKYLQFDLIKTKNKKQTNKQTKTKNKNPEKKQKKNKQTNKQKIKKQKQNNNNNKGGKKHLKQRKNISNCKFTETFENFETINEHVLLWLHCSIILQLTKDPTFDKVTNKSGIKQCKLYIFGKGKPFAFLSIN